MKSIKITRKKDGANIIRDVDISKCFYDKEVVRSNIEARCQVIRGELPYNTLIGIPLGLDKEETDLTILSLVNNTIGVTDVKKFHSVSRDRKYKATIEVGTNNGIIGAEV